MILTSLCFILLISELSLNGYLSLKHIDYTPFPESEYNKWYTAQKNVLDNIPQEDDQLYRISMYGDNNYNSSALFGYSGFNTFSSSDLYALRNALYGLGISVSNRSITENGYTDLTYMLFDKAYTGRIQRTGKAVDDRISELEEFPWRLSIAYMVSDNIKTYSPGDDPFDNQESFVKAISGKDYRFFERLELTDLDLSSYNAEMFALGDQTLCQRATRHTQTAGLYFSVTKDPSRPFYACFRQPTPQSLESAPYILGSNENYAESFTMSSGCITKGGDISDALDPSNDYVAIYFNENSLDSFACNEMYFSRFDDTEMDALHEDLLPGILTLSEWSSSHLKGTVNVTADRPLLFTSIPWDEGWQASVDGIPVNCISVLDEAFLAIDNLTPGNHVIELRYTAPGAKTGMLISLISLMIWIVLIIGYVTKKRKSLK